MIIEYLCRAVASGGGEGGLESFSPPVFGLTLSQPGMADDAQHSTSIPPALRLKDNGLPKTLTP